MIVVVDIGDVNDAIESLSRSGETAWQIGRVADGAGEVDYI